MAPGLTRTSPLPLGCFTDRTVAQAQQFSFKKRAVDAQSGIEERDVGEYLRRNTPAAAGKPRLHLMVEVQAVKAQGDQGGTGNGQDAQPNRAIS